MILVKTHTGKTFGLWPVGCIYDQFPTRGTPTTSLRLARQVSASHDKSPPCTTSHRLAREVSASHDKSLPRTRSLAPTDTWAQMHGMGIATDACGRTNLHVTKEQQLADMQAAYPVKSLNAGLTGYAAITSPSSPLCHTQNSARDTQAPSTTRTSLDLGSGVAS
jgi:hypothetical protein